MPADLRVRETDAETAVLTIRVPVDLRDQIDSALAGRPIKVPRNTWILEALLEKLARDRRKDGVDGSR